MFTINDDLSIYVTRGDIVHLSISAVNEGGAYKFKVGDVIRLKIFGKKDCADIVFQKDFPVTTESETAEIFLTGQETRIGGVINKHSDYWYEIELNPESNPQTIIGYDDDGAKVFRLFPEGRTLDKDEPEITPEDVAIIDDELDLTSKRPVENQAIARAIERTNAEIERINAEIETVKSKLDVESDGYAGCYYRIIDGETEWINPPMLNEVEYRTTERYLGKPVYTLVANIAEIEANHYESVFIEGSSVITLTEATTNSECVVEHAQFHDNGGVGSGNSIQFINIKDTAMTDVIATVKYIYND